MSGPKNWYIYTVEYYTAERKKAGLRFATAWMELENIMLNEINQLVKDKYHMISQEESNEQNKLISKIEPEEWKHGTN